MVALPAKPELRIRKSPSTSVIDSPMPPAVTLADRSVTEKRRSSDFQEKASEPLRVAVMGSWLIERLIVVSTVTVVPLVPETSLRVPLALLPVTPVAPAMASVLIETWPDQPLLEIWKVVLTVPPTVILAVPVPKVTVALVKAIVRT